MDRTLILKNSKWTATIASIWIQCTSGSLYTFSYYSPAIKSTQAYDQSTLDTVSVFKDFGANSGILSGLLYSAATASPQPPTARGGPWVVLLTGAIQCFLGYFLMWLSVTGRIPRPPVPLMCLFMLLAAHGITFLNTANVVTAVRNFPNHSGTIVGIMKGFLGLSGAILLQVYRSVIDDGPAPFLLMLALLPTLNTLLLMFCVRIHDSDEVDEKKHLNGLSMVSLIIAAYLMAVIIIDKTLTLKFAVRVVLFLVLLTLLASPAYVVASASSIMSVEGNRLLNDTDRLEFTDDEDVHRVESLNLSQAVRVMNFWLLFLTTACGMGSGLATVNNLSQIGDSLGYTDSATSTLVSLWSIWNFLGRFGGGYVSDYFIYAKGWARPLFIAITLGLMSVGHSVIASGLPGCLYIGSVVVGVCYGSQWSLMPTIASEIFGVAHFGTIFNTITIAGPVGSYILSVRVVGYIYDKEASRDGGECRGAHCFRLSFLIMATTALLGFFVAMGLFFRTRCLYKQVVVRRYRHLENRQ